MMTQRMVDMANQIAMNIPDRSRAAEGTANHLRAFWTPAMLRELDAYVATHQADVSIDVHEALVILRGAQ